MTTRHILLTGASSGIGAALARRYAGPGCRLTLLGRDDARLNAVAVACRDLGAVAHSIRVDVCNQGEMRVAVTDAELASPLTHVIANAGIGGADAMAGPHGEASDVAARLVATNLMGVINTVLPALPGMIARRQGQITLTGSLAGLIGLPQSPIYCATKAAVRVYADGLRRQLKGTNVGVMLVSPGFVDTPMSQSLPFHPPGVWSDVRAAEKIARAADAGRADVAFPAYLALALRAGMLLPRPVVDVLVRMASPKAVRP